MAALFSPAAATQSVLAPYGDAATPRAAEPVGQGRKSKCDIGSLRKGGAGRHYMPPKEVFATPRQVCNASVRETYVQGPPSYARQGACDHEKFKSLGPFKETAA